ncbi:ureidoglycolate lyase [Oscillatoria sp. CS-180]|uniref:ureidoglycolate lyase n=1 Tax=Oscillatoria sp. CS-180 TaxID=3021720 RepID=UPI002330265D|nr:ureidoglycolate lyase [Oscillatoria sp. CS-180]MDB9526932.1 ureidoglycolate lyase [Oscillatoria sp. CS-180]
MTAPSITLKSLKAEPITPEAFAPFGQVIFASEDGALYGPEDAQLKLDEGIPRFYIMRLKSRSLSFHAITRHQCCTQCLGSLAGAEWFMGVAPPGDAEDPDPDSIRAFQIPGNCFIKMHVGTWHAGPLFTTPAVDFYNLELSDTNIVDHQTCHLRSRFRLEFEIVV